jgi:alpha-1,6-mannosyl-glycoprotein beta-1,2-N-acetylglucosaminyltransferase
LNYPINRWWKANFVLDQLKLTSKGDLFIFLEEDHIVAPDILLAALTCQQYKRVHPDIRLFSLATYREDFPVGLRSAAKNLDRWYPSNNNMAMAFERDFWLELKRCKESFCGYNDYNWDWTLGAMGQPKQCNLNLRTLQLELPRAKHIGICGSHKKGTEAGGECDAKPLVDRWLRQWEEFPDARMTDIHRPLHVYKTEVKTALSPPNGGWMDTRDHELCLSFSK